LAGRPTTKAPKNIYCLIAPASSYFSPKANDTKPSGM
jgi:hypothetical protein